MKNSAISFNSRKKQIILISAFKQPDQRGKEEIDPSRTQLKFGLVYVCANSPNKTLAHGTCHTGRVYFGNL